MIKRYGLGPKRLGGMADTSVYGPDIVEMKSGDYVRYEDYVAVLESIGAGGVSGRITSKSIDEHRAEFELWAGSKADKSRGENYYKDSDTQYDWTIWKAAKGIAE